MVLLFVCLYQQLPIEKFAFNGRKYRFRLSPYMNVQIDHTSLQLRCAFFRSVLVTFSAETDT